MNDLFASIYENEVIGFYSSGFSGDIYDLFLYQKYGLVLFLSVITLVFAYYKLMDKPKFAKILYWFIVLLIAVLFNFVFLLTDARAELTAAGFDYDGEYLNLAIINAIYAAILFFITSLAVKYSSVNTSKIPF